MAREKSDTQRFSVLERSVNVKKWEWESNHNKGGAGFARPGPAEVKGL